MLHLRHTNQLENTNTTTKLRKSFTLVELIISLAVGTTLIIGTSNVLAQSLSTINETMVAGTMDNHAYGIQQKIRNELISARYINLASTRNVANKQDATLSGNQGYNYKNMYYANEMDLNFGIIYDENEKGIYVRYFPQFDRDLTSAQQHSKDISVIFKEDNSDGVKIENFKWNIDDYRMSAQIYDNPDYVDTPTKMVKYQVTLRKNYSNGKTPLVKTYYFTEVLECAI